MSSIKECIRCVGRGERGRKSLTQIQARQVMHEYLAGEVGDDQMAMLMMLIRVNNETPQEIAGFTEAFQDALTTIEADIDWPCYAGKKSKPDNDGNEQALPWHLIAALIMAQAGQRVLLHGHLDEGSTRVHCRDFVARLGIPVAKTLAEAQLNLKQHNICYLPLEVASPVAVKMLNWKKRYGLRTPINTVVRGLNPGRAKWAIRGSFHPGFQQLHAEIEGIVGGDSQVLSYKGVSGESEFNPKVSQTVWLAEQGEVKEHYWPALFDEGLQLPASCPLGTPRALYSTMANHVLATLTAVLFAKTPDLTVAEQQAKQLWGQYCMSVTPD